MLIDLHAHIVPEHFPPADGRSDASLWPCMDHTEVGRANVMINDRNYRTITSANWDVERRLAEMAEHGADAQVLSPMPELLSYWFEPANGRDICRHVNEWIASMIATAPGHFWGLGSVPLQDPALACEELAGVKALGLAGVEIGSNVNGTYLGDARFREFFAEAERLGLSVFVHSLKPQMMDAFPAPTLANPVGFPTETCLAISSIIASGTAETVPSLRLAFSHGGGTFPFLLARYQNQWSGTWNEEEPTPERRARAFTPSSPVSYARRFWYDTLLFDRRAIRFLIDMMGADQVVVGTDYPYQPPERPADRSLASLDLSDDEHRRITWDNTFAFLGLPVPESATALVAEAGPGAGAGTSGE